MKKQLFSILMLALFAISFSAAYGQAVNNPAILPNALTCTTTDPLNPIAGRPYDYSAIINPALGTAFWYATKSTTFTTAGVRVATVIPANGVAIATGATGYNVAIPNATSPTTTQVTWTSAGLAGVTAANPLFMVVEYSGPTCSNNMKVMRILPKNAFTIDITNLENVAGTTLPYGTIEDQCFANVADMKYDPAGNSGAGDITIDYGINTLYYEVIAANFTGSYSPTFKLTGLSGTQTADIDWGVVKGTYNQSLSAGVSGTPITTGATNVTTSQTNTKDGVSIYIRVTVYNHGYEGTANETITLAVQAVDAFANADVQPDCTIAALPYEDLATQTLKARPAITPGTTMLPQKL